MFHQEKALGMKRRRKNLLGAGNGTEMVERRKKIQIMPL